MKHECKVKIVRLLLTIALGLVVALAFLTAFPFIEIISIGHWSSSPQIMTGYSMFRNIISTNNSILEFFIIKPLFILAVLVAGLVPRKLEQRSKNLNYMLMLLAVLMLIFVLTIFFANHLVWSTHQETSTTFLPASILAIVVGFIISGLYTACFVIAVLKEKDSQDPKQCLCESHEQDTQT